MRPLFDRLKSISENSVVRYGITSIMTRGLAILSTLLLTPLIIGRLGVEDYGIWFMATLIPTVIAFPDLGISNGIINRVAHIVRTDGAIDKFFETLEDLEGLLRVFSIFWLIIGSGALIVYTASLQNHQSVHLIFQSLSISLIIFCMGIAPILWTKVQLALERGHQSVAWEGAGKLTSLMAAVTVLYTYPDVRLLIIATLLPPVIALYFNAWHFKSSEYREKVNNGPKKKLVQVLLENIDTIKDGGYFTIIQIAFILGFALDSFIIGSLVSVDAVSYVSVARRPFDALPLVVTLFSTALWPVFNRMQANAEYRKSFKIIAALMVWSTLAVLGASITIIFFKEVIYGFLGQKKFDISSNDLFWIAFKGWTITIVIILQNYISAVNLIKQQAWIQLFSAMTGLAVVIFFLLKENITGYLAATAIVYFILNLLPMFYLATSDLRNRLLGRVP